MVVLFEKNLEVFFFKVCRVKRWKSLCRIEVVCFLSDVLVEFLVRVLEKDLIIMYCVKVVLRWLKFMSRLFYDCFLILWCCKVLKVR